MLRFEKRPELPPDFISRTQDARDAVKAAIDNGESPDFPHLWGKYKSAFMEIQNGKCGYCETKIYGNQYGDVEHYRPKSAVWKSIDAGRCEEWVSGVRERKRTVTCNRGYWWLAYEWSNYLVACQICNQNCKGAIFPIRGGHTKNPAPGDEEHEEALLLNPFDSLCPSDYLHFGELGELEAIDEEGIGQETIDTCGLDREGLRDSRQEKAERAYKLMGQLSHLFQHQGESSEVDRLLKDLHELGNPRYAYAGMVRIIVKHGLGLSWSELSSWVEDL